MTRCRIGTVVFAALLISSAPFAGEGWRVDGRLITAGDSKVRVLDVAGPPDWRENLYAREGGVVGERWYYLRDGPRVRARIVTFSRGRVAALETDYR